jgi:hypothetical protein
MRLFHVCRLVYGFWHRFDLHFPLLALAGDEDDLKQFHLNKFDFHLFQLLGGFRITEALPPFSVWRR